MTGTGAPSAAETSSGARRTRRLELGNLYQKFPVRHRRLHETEAERLGTAVYAAGVAAALARLPFASPDLEVHAGLREEEADGGHNKEAKSDPTGGSNIVVDVASAKNLRRNEIVVRRAAEVPIIRPPNWSRRSGDGLGRPWQVLAEVGELGDDEKAREENSPVQSGPAALVETE